MPTFSAPKPLQFLQFEKDRDDNKQLTIAELKKERHEKFKLKGEPAPVYVVIDHDDDEQKKLWSVTSTQLADTLDAMKKELGTIFGIRMTVWKKGKGTATTYEVEVSEKEIEQQRISAG